jgi:hypothetical protein
MRNLLRLQCAWLAGCCAAAFAQTPTTEQNVVYTTDINGRRVEQTRVVTSTSNGTTVSGQYNSNINGGLAPLEKVQERVIRDDPAGRVVERIIQRHDQTGKPGLSEKVQIEERRNPDGSLSVVSTIYRGDLNGRMQLAERSTTESRKTGNTTNANTTIERPTLNGSMETVEKKVLVSTESPAGVQEEVTTLRKDQAGRFSTAYREVTQETVENGHKVTNTREYEPGMTMGRLEFRQQTVTRAAPNPDGTQSREVDIYRRLWGRADSSDQPPQLMEQQLIEQRKTPDGLVESISVRRPTISEPNRLGPAQKIAEKVCTGPCK